MSSVGTMVSPAGRSIIPSKADPHSTSLVTSIDTVCVSPGAMEKPAMETVMLSPYVRTATVSSMRILIRRLHVCMPCAIVFIFLLFLLLLTNGQRESLPSDHDHYDVLFSGIYPYILLDENLLHTSGSVTYDVDTLPHRLSLDTVSVEYRSLAHTLSVNGVDACDDSEVAVHGGEFTAFAS